MDNQTAVLRNVQNSDLYRHLQGDTYRNLRTGAEGEIAPEIAQRILKINVAATLMFNKHPHLEGFVERLKLKADVPE